MKGWVSKMSDDLNYKPNSRRSKEAQKSLPAEKKKVEKVVTGKAKTKKKGELRKFKDVFISEDVSNVKTYVFMDVLIPAAKKAISDIVSNGIDMILYGETRGRKGGTSASYVSYRDYSTKRDNRTVSARSRSIFDYDEIILDSRADAEDILDRMGEILETYGVVSVADMYDLAGLTCDFTYNRYGWTSIRNGEVVHVRDGYVIKMPRAMAID